MAVSNKNKMLAGIFFVGMSFVCLTGVFYFMINNQKAKAQETATLNEQITLLKTEKEAGERKLAEIEKSLGKSVRLENVLQAANQTLDPKEKDRREGYLWVDRQGQSWIITLGALNGVSIGTRLTVYDGETKVGIIKVLTPLDVISYVQPLDDSVKGLKDDYYRVVLEN